MTENNWLEEHFNIDHKGFATFKTDYPIQVLSNNSEYNWVHLNCNAPETRAWLTQNTDIEPIWIEALLAKETRPRFVKIDDDTFFINIRGVNLFNKNEPEDMISIRLLVTKSQIISTKMRTLKAIDKLKRDFDTRKSPKNTTEFVMKLIEHMNNEIEAVIVEIHYEIDDLEESVLVAHDKDFRQNVIDIRRQMIIFRRYLYPNLDALNHLKQMEQFFDNNDENKNSLSEATYKMTRFTEEIMSIKERAQVIHEELNNHLTEKLSSSTNKLSAVATIFLPMGFITGLFGVNIGGIPGSTNENAFTIFTIVTGAILLIQILIFRWFKWF